MLGYFRWEATSSNFVGGQYQPLVTDAAWLDYYPVNPTGFRLIVRETNSPGASDQFTLVSGKTYDPYWYDDQSGPWNGTPFQYIGHEIFFRDVKVGNVHNAGNGVLMITLIPNPFPHSLGLMAGFIAYDIQYTNSSSEFSGQQITGQQLELVIMDGLQVISRSLSDLNDTWDVDAANTLPVAASLTPSAPEGTASIAIQLSAQDPDWWDDIVSFTISSLPAGGGLYADAAGTQPLAAGSIIAATAGKATIYFRPTSSDFYGNPWFDYYAFDGEGYSPANVTIAVLPVNDAPSFVPLTTNIQSPEDVQFGPATWAVSLSTGPGNEIGQILAFEVSTNNTALFSQQPAVSPNGQLTFRPAPNATGTANVTVTLRDNGGTDNGGVDSFTRNLSITITPVNDAPIASPQPESKAGVEDVPVQGQLLAGSDVDGDALTFKLVSSAGGSVTVNATTGAYTFTPQLNFNGAASFRYVVNDGRVDSAAKTVNLVLAPVNDAPVSSPLPEVHNGIEDQQVQGQLRPGSDVDSSSLLWLGTGSFGGAYVLQANTGNFTFTPWANYSGVATMTYVVSDGQLTSAPKTVTIDLAPVNDAPVPSAAPESGNGVEGQLVQGALLPGSDVDGDVLTFKAVGAVGGNVSVNVTTGVYTFTPQANYNGLASFSYVVNDGQVDSVAKTVNITLAAANTAPVTASAPEDKAGVEDQAVLGTLLAGSDADGDALTFKAVGAAGGSVTVNAATGAYTFIPDANYYGNASFSYVVSDGQLDSAAKTVNLTLAPVNDAPVAAGASEDRAVLEDEQVQGTLLAGSDVDGDALTFRVVGGSNATVALNATTGAYFLVPPLNYHGAAYFSYVVNDGKTDSAAKTVNVTFASVNDRPLVSTAPENTTGAEDQLVQGTLLAGSDYDDDVLKFKAVGAVGGDVAVDAVTGAYVFTPQANYNGVASFRYVVNDGQLDSSAKTVNITLAPVNDVPIAAAAPESNAGLEDQQLQGTLLAGSDVDGDSLTFKAIGAVGGSVALDAVTGSYIFTPLANFNGAASFSYVVNDGQADSAAKTVSIALAAVNDAPIAAAALEDKTGVEDQLVQGQLLAGSDVDGDALTFKAVSAVGGSVTVDATTGAYTFTPLANFNGAASFSYVVNDGQADSTAKTVSIALAAVNDAPVVAVASEDGNGVEDQLVQGTLLAGSDVDGDALTFKVVDAVVGGNVTVDAGTGAYTFTPQADFNGIASFSYVVNDGQADSAAKTVSITLTPVNDAPVIAAASEDRNGVEDQQMQGTLLAGSDVDGDALTFKALGAIGGDVAVDAVTGAYVFTPQANFNGAASFSYVVNDGQADSTAKTVSIALAAVNDAPVVAVASEDGNGVEDQLVQGTLLAGSDVDGDALTFKALSASGGSVAVNATTGAYTFTPGANFNGAASFTYVVTDGQADSTVKTVSIAVAPVNDAPAAAAAAESSAGPEDQTVQGTLLAGTDVDGDALTFRAIGSADGTVTIHAATGAYTFTPDANFNGAASFSYVVNDGQADSAVKTVSIAVAPVNDAPVTAPSSENRNGVEDHALQGLLLAGSDVEGDALTFKAMGAAGGSVVIDAATGAYTFTPGANFNGAASFSYVVNDGQADSAVKMVHIAVAAVNDAPVVAAAAESNAGLEDQAVQGTLLAGSDVDGDALTFKAVSAVDGTVTVDASTGAYTFAPNANFNGTASFAYVVNDGQADSAAKTVSIALAAVNDAPVISVASEDRDGVEDQLVQGTLLAGSDVDGDTLAFKVVGAIGGGATVDAATGAYVFTPLANFNGTASFSYVVNDGQADSATKTVHITLAAVNDAPVAADDTGFATIEDNALNLSSAQLLANDTDVDAGDHLQLASVAATSALGASVVFDPQTGTIRYLADSQQFDSLGAGNKITDSFSYVVRDALGLESTALVVVEVTGAANGANIIGTVRPDAGSTALVGTARNELIRGNNGGDELHGMAGADRLFGENGDDKLFGGAGQDFLSGDNGNDMLRGGLHSDDLFGGLGNDEFVFGADAVAGEVDRIGDLKRGNDLIRLVDGVTVTHVEIRDVGRASGGAISATADGVNDTVITLSSGAIVQVIGIASSDLQGLLAG